MGAIGIPGCWSGSILDGSFSTCVFGCSFSSLMVPKDGERPDKHTMQLVATAVGVVNSVAMGMAVACATEAD